MVRTETVTQTAAGAADPRAEVLRTAVDRVCRELAAHPAQLPDRAAAEEELARLRAMALRGTPEVARLRGALLLVAAALGSVSALAASLTDLRQAVDAFGRSSRPGG